MGNHRTVMSFNSDLIKAVVLYLTDLNQYSASSSGSSIQDEKLRLLRYNVGGVIVIADVLKAAIREDNQTQDVSLTNDELLDLFKKSWYSSSSMLQVKPKFKNFFNSAYDPSCTLNYAVAQIIEIFGDTRYNNDSFISTITGLLRHYNNYINEKDQKKVPDAITGYEYLKLVQDFETNHALKLIEKRQRAKKVVELRKMGNEYLKSGRFGIAIATYTEGILIDPRNYILYSARAAAYTYLQSIDDAIEDLLKSLEIKPDFETSWTRLGFCYLGKGKAIESLKAYINSIKYAHKNKALQQYILKLIDSLRFAEERACSQGHSHQEMWKLIEPIKPIIDEYEKAAISSRRQPSSHAQNTEVRRTPQPPTQAQNSSNPLASMAENYLNRFLTGENGVFSSNSTNSSTAESAINSNTGSTAETPNNSIPSSNATPAAAPAAPTAAPATTTTATSGTTVMPGVSGPRINGLVINHSPNLPESIRNSIGGIINHGLHTAMNSMNSMVNNSNNNNITNNNSNNNNNNYNNDNDQNNDSRTNSASASTSLNGPTSNSTTASSELPQGSDSHGLVDDLD